MIDKEMTFFNSTADYSDIMNMPHHVSKTRPQMSLNDRAAQFCPFAALTGYDAAIKETARLTDEKIDLDENSKESLDEKLKFLMSKLSERPIVTITYFKADERKNGGSYELAEGCVRKVDFYERALVMEDRAVIRMDDIIAIDIEFYKGF